jgi:glycosyltransferase involved in cell wall biosynthesis
MPVKNGIEFLPQAKDMISKNCDVLDQIIVINDNSSDGSGEFLRNWAAEDSRVKVIDNSDSGLVSALNLGLSSAQHEWVARFDVDDIYLPSRISRQIAAISPQTVAIFSDYSLGTSSLKTLGTIPSGVDSDVVAISLFKSQRTAHPSVVFSKSHVLKVGGYRVADFPAEDLSLWLRLVNVGELISVPEVLLNYQLNPTSVTRLNQGVMISKRLDLLKEFPIAHKFVFSISNRWKSIFRDYSSYPQVGLRRLLLCVDFANFTFDRGQRLSRLMTLSQMIVFLITRPSTYVGLFEAVRLFIRKRFLPN